MYKILNNKCIKKLLRHHLIVPYRSSFTITHSRALTYGDGLVLVDSVQTMFQRKLKKKNIKGDKLLVI